MPQLAKAFSAKTDKILDLALMAERLRSHIHLGQSVREDLTIHRTRLFLERMCLLKQLYKGREPFLRNKDIAAQKPLSSTEVQLLPVVSVFGIGVDEK